MKLKFLLLALIIIWGSGCVAYITPHDVVTVDIRPPRAVVRITTPPVVHYVHHSRPVVRHVRHTRRHRVVRRHRHHRHHHRHTRSCHHRRH